MSTKPKKIASVVYEWLDALVFALLAVAILFVAFFKVYAVLGASMEPTLRTGNRVFAWCFLYEPAQGDIVILDEELVLGESIVKRVVAIEGQVVDIDEETGEITVDGIVFDEPVATSLSNLNGNMHFPLRVPDGHVFVMGDNRGNSHDSRYTTIGFVDERSVMGNVLYVFGPGGNGKVE